MKILIGNPIREDAVTTVIVPDDLNLGDRFLNTLGALSLHLAEGQSPIWIKSDDAALQAMLEDHYQGRSK